MLPLEFARQSSKGSSAGALTLVVIPGYSPPVRSLWTLLSTDTPDAARESLRRRERVPKQDREKSIALWNESDAHEPSIPGLSDWARDHKLSAVVWTALPPRFNDETDRIPTLGEAVSYLRGLTGERRQNAESYIRKAPRQITTPYREHFVDEFDWTSIGAIETRPQTFRSSEKDHVPAGNPAQCAREEARAARIDDSLSEYVNWWDFSLSASTGTVSSETMGTSGTL